MKWVVLDLETSVNNCGDGAVGKMAASPHSPRNNIVLQGELLSNGEELISGGVRCIPEVFEIALEEEVLLVGHNISFDLLYLMKSFPTSWKTAAKNIYVWDTQQVAYLLSGQSNMFASLDSCCEEVGYPLKPDKIKQYWKDGVRTEDIPTRELKEYLSHDLAATKAVFQYQYNQAKDDKALMALIKVKGDDILMSTIMMHNGMEFDTLRAYEIGEEVSRAISQVEADIQEEVGKTDWPTTITPFSPSSPQNVSTLLFGGSVKYMDDIVVYNPDGSPYKYKTGAKKGEVKTRKEEVEVAVRGFGITPDSTWTLGKTGYYPTGDAVLKDKLFDATPLAKLILTMRELQKELVTYIQGYSELAWGGNRIHPNINNCSTATGRQSCTTPNLQNVTTEDSGGEAGIKHCFTSRFDRGSLLEADFSQLEVVGLAILSQDEQLIDDIQLGLDMHRKRAAELFGKAEEDVTDAERKITKQLSFQLQYGAGAKSMAASNGISEDVAKKFIAQYYSRYTGVKQWQDDLAEEVKKSRVPSGEHTARGYPKGVGMHVSVTGRRYTFKEFDAPDWSTKGDTAFSPTQMKNFPVQGFATGDVMAVFRSMLYRELIKNPSTSLAINTVHDSVMFDCPGAGGSVSIEGVLKRTAAALPAKLLSLWGVKSPLKFPITVSVGKNWGEMKKLTY